uniref:Uncharacterized protein n=1 Tax=Hubei diptera virus 20 TaxID=1922881 RepID=A0A1L3KPC9_9VIRU|nr:hypothetical protein 2 [Hubei diptera virus 20]
MNESTSKIAKLALATSSSQSDSILKLDKKVSEAEALVNSMSNRLRDVENFKNDFDEAGLSSDELSTLVKLIKFSDASKIFKELLIKQDKQTCNGLTDFILKSDDVSRLMSMDSMDDVSFMNNHVVAIYNMKGENGIVNYNQETSKMNVSIVQDDDNIILKMSASDQEAQFTVYKHILTYLEENQPIMPYGLLLMRKSSGIYYQIVVTLNLDDGSLTYNRETFTFDDKLWNSFIRDLPLGAKLITDFEISNYLDFEFAKQAIFNYVMNEGIKSLDLEINKRVKNLDNGGVAGAIGQGTVAALSQANKILRSTILKQSAVYEFLGSVKTDLKHSRYRQIVDPEPWESFTTEFISSIDAMLPAEPPPPPWSKVSDKFHYLRFSEGIKYQIQEKLQTQGTDKVLIVDTIPANDDHTDMLVFNVSRVTQDETTNVTMSVELLYDSIEIVDDTNTQMIGYSNDKTGDLDKFEPLDIIPMGHAKKRDIDRMINIHSYGIIPASDQGFEQWTKIVIGTRMTATIKHKLRFRLSASKILDYGSSGSLTCRISFNWNGNKRDLTLSFVRRRVNLNGKEVLVYEAETSVPDITYSIINGYCTRINVSDVTPNFEGLTDIDSLDWIESELKVEDHQQIYKTGSTLRKINYLFDDLNGEFPKIKTRMWKDTDINTIDVGDPVYLPIMAYLDDENKYTYKGTDFKITGTHLYNSSSYLDALTIGTVGDFLDLDDNGQSFSIYGTRGETDLYMNPDYGEIDWKFDVSSAFGWTAKNGVVIPYTKFVENGLLNPIVFPNYPGTPYTILSVKTNFEMTRLVSDSIDELQLPDGILSDLELTENTNELLQTVQLLLKYSTNIQFLINNLSARLENVEKVMGNIVESVKQLSDTLNGLIKALTTTPTPSPWGKAGDILGVVSTAIGLFYPLVGTLFGTLAQTITGIGSITEGDIVNGSLEIAIAGLNAGLGLYKLGKRLKNKYKRANVPKEPISGIKDANYKYAYGTQSKSEKLVEDSPPSYTELFGTKNHENLYVRTSNIIFEPDLVSGNNVNVVQFKRSCYNPLGAYEPAERDLINFNDGFSSNFTFEGVVIESGILDIFDKDGTLLRQEYELYMYATVDKVVKKKSLLNDDKFNMLINDVEKYIRIRDSYGKLAVNGSTLDYDHDIVLPFIVSHAPKIDNSVSTLSNRECRSNHMQGMRKKLVTSSALRNTDKFEMHVRDRVMLSDEMQFNVSCPYNYASVGSLLTTKAKDNPVHRYAIERNIEFLQHNAVEELYTDEP